MPTLFYNLPLTCLHYHYTQPTAHHTSDGFFPNTQPYPGGASAGSSSSVAGSSSSVGSSSSSSSSSGSSIGGGIIVNV